MSYVGRNFEARAARKAFYKSDSMSYKSCRSTKIEPLKPSDSQFLRSLRVGEGYGLQGREENAPMNYGILAGVLCRVEGKRRVQGEFCRMRLI